MYAQVFVLYMICEYIHLGVLFALILSVYSEIFSALLLWLQLSYTAPTFPMMHLFITFTESGHPGQVLETMEVCCPSL